MVDSFSVSDFRKLWLLLVNPNSSSKSAKDWPSSSRRTASSARASPERVSSSSVVSSSAVLSSSAVVSSSAVLSSPDAWELSAAVVSAAVVSASVLSAPAVSAAVVSSAAVLSASVEASVLSGALVDSVMVTYSTVNIWLSSSETVTSVSCLTASHTFTAVAFFCIQAVMLSSLASLYSVKDSSKSSRNSAIASAIRVWSSSVRVISISSAWSFKIQVWINCAITSSFSCWPRVVYSSAGASHMFS